MVNPITLNYPTQTSEQSMIELVYIKTANQVLGQSLSNLEYSLTVNKAILTTLNQIQQQKNQLQVVSKGSLGPFNENNYENKASGFFGSPIIPTIGPGFDAAAVGQLRSDLDAQLEQLKTLVPGIDTDPNSIYSKGKQVVLDMTDPNLWVLDNYDQINSTQTGDAGKYQSNLTVAITAGESLNDTQKEQVRRYLFIFEEYYKSAGSVLNKITQILERIAQNISRG